MEVNPQDEPARGLDRSGRCRNVQVPDLWPSPYAQVLVTGGTEPELVSSTPTVLLAPCRADPCQPSLCELI